MRCFKMFVLLLTMAVFLGSLFCQVSNAASVWPDSKREFNLVATYNPGGQVDAICSISAPYLEKYMGMRVVVQNIPGSGGLLGTNSVFAGKSDGYTAVYTAATDGMIGYMNLSYIPPEERVGTFAAINKTVASYADLHKKYVKR